jgi:hypothetical protein
MRKSKQPIRFCVGCRTRREKRELLRIVRTPEDEVIWDSTGKKNGRGAYICPKLECLHQALKTKSLQRALGRELEADLIANLEEKLKQNNDTIS